MKKILHLAITYVAVLFITGCGQNSSTQNTDFEGDTLTSYSKLLTLAEHDGYFTATIADPWNPGNYLQKLVLADEQHADAAIDGYTTVTVPLKKTLVYSTVFSAAIEELKRVESIIAVADAQYFRQTSILERLKTGSIKDAGSALSPNVEIIVACKPDAIINNPYQNAGHGVVGTLGIPIIEMADYMERTPLARAEWIKFLGILYGNKTAADSIFNATVKSYTTLKAKAPKNGPKVLTEMLTSGVWYVPGGKSYMAQMLQDAGANYPWSDDTSAGSLQLDFATVYDKAHDADFWFVKSFGDDTTLESLGEAYSLNKKFKAYSSGGVYSVNTSNTDFFESYPYHPDTLLRDYIIIFAPDSLPGEQTSFYKPVK